MISPDLAILAALCTNGKGRHRGAPAAEGVEPGREHRPGSGLAALIPTMPTLDRPAAPTGVSAHQ
jgi:hypothetical protein